MMDVGIKRVSFLGFVCFHQVLRGGGWLEKHTQQIILWLALFLITSRHSYSYFCDIDHPILIRNDCISLQETIHVYSGLFSVHWRAPYLTTTIPYNGATGLHPTSPVSVHKIIIIL